MSAAHCHAFSLALGAKCHYYGLEYEQATATGNREEKIRLLVVMALASSANSAGKRTAFGQCKFLRSMKTKPPAAQLDLTHFSGETPGQTVFKDVD